MVLHLLRQGKMSIESIRLLQAQFELLDDDGSGGLTLEEACGPYGKGMGWVMVLTISAQLERSASACEGARGGTLRGQPPWLHTYYLHTACYCILLHPTARY